MIGSRRRVLVWGAGAIGGTAGAYLRRAGHDVTMVDIEAAHVAAIRDPTRGLAISGPVDKFTLVTDAAVPADLRGVWDIVLLAVKGHHTQAACHALLPHLGSDGFVVSLQNGLCEDVIASVVGRARTIGCFVNFAADWLGPGEVRYGQRGVLALGELDGAMSQRLQDLVVLLRDFEPNAMPTEDIGSYLWGKLGFATMLYVTAIAASPMVALLERPDLLPVWKTACGETMQVAHQLGVRPRGFDGFRPEAFLPEADPADAAASVRDMLKILRPSAKTHSGMWRDIAVRKRRTEVDVQLVPIIEMGEANGLACPTLRRLVDRMHALERGDAVQSDDAPLALLG